MPTISVPLIVTGFAVGAFPIAGDIAAVGELTTGVPVSGTLSTGVTSNEIFAPSSSTVKR